MQDSASKMENKRKTLLLLLLLVAESFFCMPNVTDAASDVNFEGHLTHSEVACRLATFLNFVLCLLIITVFTALAFFSAAGETTHQKVFVICGLWREVQSEMQFAVKAKDLCKSLRDMLFKVQLCSSGHLWEQRGVWKVLHRHDHSWKQT
ncbi:hypothetical protein DEO72_LG2g2552 [Vigna unguiculata]|uniref:Uncharacterized protein n=1 Tax=Vigna unguiculata TaxID=3917 RepID=A0A4D6L151_VIGUN|nr:hypothetical protein DEO72_LG2g2552 [Vigna unguiculata]